MLPSKTNRKKVTSKRHFGSAPDDSQHTAKKAKTISAELSDEDKQFTNEIEICLKGSLINLLILKLGSFKNHHKLDALIEYDKFRLFGWALENCNIPLINYLLENLSVTQSTNMLKYENYSAIKKFISASKSSWEKVANQVDPILKAILDIKPEQEALEVIQSKLSDQLAQASNETIKYLQNYIKFQTASVADTDPTEGSDDKRRVRFQL